MATISRSMAVRLGNTVEAYSGLVEKKRRYASFATWSTSSPAG